MTVIDETHEHELHDEEELPTRLSQYELITSSGKPGEGGGLPLAKWGVLLTTDGDRIRRDVWLGGKPWNVQAEGWGPEGIIWPTWPAKATDEASSSKSALRGVEKY